MAIYAGAQSKQNHQLQRFDRTQNVPGQEPGHVHMRGADRAHTKHPRTTQRALVDKWESKGLVIALPDKAYCI